MLDVLQTLGPALVNSSVAAGVFFYLWRRDRQDYLAIWAVAWSLWVARYAYGLASVEVELIPASVVVPSLALGRGALMLWGTYSLLRQSMPRAWLVVWSADAALIVAEAVRGAPFPMPGQAGLAHYLLFGTSLAWSGALFLSSSSSLPRTEGRLTGCALVVFGVAQVTYPMLGTWPDWYARGVYVLVYALQAAIPLGLLLAYLKRASDEISELDDALARALTRALAEHVPICTHCKAIRVGPDWSPLEHYLATQTSARLSHGICPACFEAYYPEYGP